LNSILTACSKAGCRKNRPEIIAQKQCQTRHPVAALPNLAQREWHNCSLPTNVFLTGRVDFDWRKSVLGATRLFRFAGQIPGSNRALE
jgi:hypothetical protein